MATVSADDNQVRLALSGATQDLRLHRAELNLLAHRYGTTLREPGEETPSIFHQIILEFLWHSRQEVISRIRDDWLHHVKQGQPGSVPGQHDRAG